MKPHACDDPTSFSEGVIMACITVIAVLAMCNFGGC